MGDEQQAAPAGEAKWGDPIGETRQAELDALAARQRAWAEQPAEDRGDSPLGGAGQLTGADVRCLATLALASQQEGQGDAAAALVAAQAHLRAAAEDTDAGLWVPRGLDLSALHLEQAHLAGAHLEGAFLRGAHLEQADLGEAYLVRADLGGAYLETLYINPSEGAAKRIGAGRPRCVRARAWAELRD